MFKKLFNVVSLVGNWNRILYLPGTGNIKYNKSMESISFNAPLSSRRILTAKGLSSNADIFALSRRYPIKNLKLFKQ